MRKLITAARERKKTSIAILSIVVVFVIVASWGTQPKRATVRVERGTIRDEVSVTGMTKASQNVALAFERGGTVFRIGAKIGERVGVGQTLIALEASELAAGVREAEANLAIQEVKLAELNRGSRPEEILITEAKQANALQALTDAERALFDAIRDGYAKADDAVRNKADQLFNNPQSQTPSLIFSINDTMLMEDVLYRRMSVEALFTVWRTSLELPGISATDAARAGAENLSVIALFLEKTSLATSNMVGTRSVAQTTIDGWRSTVSTARTAVSNAISSLTAAREKFAGANAALTIANRELSLARAGATPEARRAQELTVQQTKARLDATRAQLSKTVLRAPFAGTVTAQEAAVGEIVSANAPVVSLMTLQNFEIETNIPEVDIGNISVGNSARVSFDALPNESFNATVLLINPAETVIDGVVTFKVTLALASSSDRMKSGLTANVAIVTKEKSNVLIVSPLALIEEDGGTYVERVREKNTFERVMVRTGIRGEDGTVEITDGLNEGDELIDIGTKQKTK